MRYIRTFITNKRLTTIHILKDTLVVQLEKLNKFIRDKNNLIKNCIVIKSSKDQDINNYTYRKKSNIRVIKTNI